MFVDTEEILNRIEHCIRIEDGKGFIEIFNQIAEQKLSLDFQKIKNSRKKIAELLVSVLRNSIQTSEFSNFFQILDIANRFRLLKLDNNQVAESKLNSVNNSDLLMLENLHDLFGNIDSDFISFIINDLPGHVLKLIVTLAPNFMPDFYEKERIYEIRTYVENHFYLYGFRVRKVDMFDHYVKNYQQNKRPYGKGYYSLKIKRGPSIIQSRYFFEFYDSIHENHILREDMFEELIEKHKTNKIIFNYPCVSMVISGGIGPQGKGFAYLTPKNEVIEICSDAQQNKAYIIEFKKFLKSIFLSKLEERLKNSDISIDLIEEIIDFLDSLIKVEFVSSKLIDPIWDKVEAYLYKKLEKSLITEDFILFLEKSIYNILVPVKIEDQFKTRMDLIKDNKLSPTDISKLVSLGSISHFDILCQRRFFLYMLDNIMSIYLKDE